MLSRARRGANRHCAQTGTFRPRCLHGEYGLAILAQVLGSIWGIGAGISLTVAVVAAVGFKGRLRNLCAAAGTGFAVVFAALALIAAPSEAPPGVGGQRQASPAASFEVPCVLY